MGKKIIRNKELTQKEADFYSNLNWKGKTKRIRKKANKILEHDCYLDIKDKTMRSKGKRINKIIDLSKEKHVKKEYKCIRRVIEFKLKDDGINIEVIGAKVINAKEVIIRL